MLLVAAHAGFVVGKIDKGVKCSVLKCEKDAVRSIAAGKVAGVGLEIDAQKRAYLCKTHYKEYKRASKKDRTLERWRHKDSR